MNITLIVSLLIIAALFFLIFFNAMDFVRWWSTNGADQIRTTKKKIIQWVGIPLMILLGLLFICILTIIITVITLAFLGI